MKHTFKYILLSIFSWVIALDLLMLFRFGGQNSIKVEWKLELIGATTSGVVLGTIFSIIDICINKTKIRQKPFTFIVLIKSLVFLIAIIFAIVITVFTVQIIVESNSYGGFINELSKAFSSEQTLIYIFYSILISVLFYYNQQVSKKIGPRIRS